MCNRFALVLKWVAACVLAVAFAWTCSFGAPPKADGDTPDPEASTHWNKSPQWERDPDGAYHAIGLKSFEGIEEPTKKFVVAKGKVESDDFVNITDMPEGVVRMTLRYRSDWWDGDQSTGTERSAAQDDEVGLGPHQKTGETFEYRARRFELTLFPTVGGGSVICFKLKRLMGTRGHRW